MKKISILLSLVVLFTVFSCDEDQDNPKSGNVTFGANYHVINCITTVTIFLDGKDIGTLQNFTDAINDCGEAGNITKNIPVGEYPYRVEIRGNCSKDITGILVVSENECTKIFIDLFQLNFDE